MWITDLLTYSARELKRVLRIGAQSVIPPRSEYPNQVERVFCRFRLFRRSAVYDEMRAHKLMPMLSVTGR